MRMKNIFKSLVAVAGAAILFTSCKKEADLPLYSTGKVPVLSSSVTTVAPAPADSNNTVLTLSWTNPEFAVDTTLYKYIVQIDSAGRNFSKAYSKQVNAQLSTSFIAKELNNALVAFGFAFGRPVTIEVRVIASYANNNDRKISNTVTLQATPYVVPPKVRIPANRELYLVGSATAGSWGNPVPSPAQKFTMIDTVTYEGTFYLAGGNEYLMLPVNGNWDSKYAVADNTVPGLREGGEFGYFANSAPSGFNSNFPGPAEDGTYKIRVDFQNGRFTVTPVKIFGLLRVAGDYQGWDPATAPKLASRNADGVYEGYVNVPSGGTYEFKFTSAPNWGGTNYGGTNPFFPGGNGTISTSGGNLSFPEGAGYYKLNVNVNEESWTYTKTTWGVVGSFTNWGADPDVAMNYDAGSRTWSANVSLSGNTQLKFRANSDWGINLGDTGSDGSLEQDGANLELPAGNYTLTLYLNNAGYYTYKIQ